MITLSTEILLYESPFDLFFSIVGTEGEKNCYISIFKRFFKGRLEVFFQGESFPTKKEVIDNLERILRVAIYNCQKVEKVVDNLYENPKGRRLTLEMVKEIIATFNPKDVWDIDTSEKKWKMKFLTKADGLVEGQDVSIVFLEGSEKGAEKKGKLLTDIKSTYSFLLEGMQYHTAAVHRVENIGDGVYMVILDHALAKVTITNTRQ